jgi:hypothetical protein
MMENFTRADVSHIKPPYYAGHRSLIHNSTSATIAMRTFRYCDVEPIVNQIYVPEVVYKKRHIDKRLVNERQSPESRKKTPK